MSRVGKQIITLPEKVTYSQEGSVVTIKGPLGAISRDFNPAIIITKEGETLKLSPTKQDVDTNALWGMVGAHLRNMVLGVTKGYEKKLIIEGVGYRAALTGTSITFSLGLSHPVVMPVPAGLKVTVEKNVITITGINKDEVGQFAAKLRDLKKPEPYKGKGIRYDGEVIRRKEGKKVVS
jgi:large subunit ribosomal protein L6